MKKILLAVTILTVLLISGFYHPADRAEGTLVVVDTLASSLIVPWDICFLPSGDMLFTERNGKVRKYADGRLDPKPVLQVPDIEVEGKRGLLGLCLHPDFARNHFLYLAYNHRDDDKSLLRVARYEYVDDSLINPKTIIEGIPASHNHTGCRLKFGPDKKLYITTGDADMPMLSQDLKAFNGKILRLNDDGSIPADNPFMSNDTARHEIWTYGHRNSQGIAFQPGTNLLFNTEHGPTGGDEVNLISKGKNYGWPVIHHRDVKPGMTKSLMEFSPSIGPAEALFYSGKAFPALKGHLLAGNMRGEAILNVTLKNQQITAYNFLFKNMFGRIRALAEGPDGTLYISTSMIDPPETNMTVGEKGYDLLLHIRPAKPGERDRAINLETSGTMIQAINNTAPKPPGNSERKPEVLYAQLCASCHGASLEGKDKVPSLVDDNWVHGGQKSDIIRSIRDGIISKGMPAWRGVLTKDEIDKIAGYILNKGRK
ncbi:PQQ-dependent sugar dehydrogenase [Danxiaibacter flavus]|uniref:PQQ-dependent sugar dehydrogenase n=1 Tax=Danxiaibacter flavus TaxID=3049108 RepID=A0ABV3ZMR2_9BACT|nr:PQQ-dependent sugar dehydrogenase [Chitinophagaceae bacterium DXS]